MKLKAKIAISTKGPGIMSQGAFEMAFRFWASKRRVPQLMAGGRSPRKLNAVSAMIIAGTANVVVAMMWLVKEGSMCRKIIRSSVAPYSRADRT
jgi:hypothetical protein